VIPVRGGEHKQIQSPFLITGCARSGTTFLYEALKKSGVKVGHEMLAQDGCVAWQCAFDKSYGSYKWNFPVGTIRFNRILHVVRDPIKVITSMYNQSIPPAHASWNHAWRYICSVCPEISLNDPPLIRCAKYWYYWNLSAEKRAAFTFRIEDVEKNLDLISQFIGHTVDKNIIANMPKNVNHYRIKTDYEISWASLSVELEPSFFHRLQELALKYGYPIED